MFICDQIKKFMYSVRLFLNLIIFYSFIRGAMFNTTKVADLKSKSGKGTKKDRKGEIFKMFEIIDMKNSKKLSPCNF